MPWTKDDAGRHKGGLTDAQKEQWASIANSVLESCLSEGFTTDECEEKAIKQANGSVGDSMQNVDIKNNSYVIRTETYQGRNYLVVPVVMMTEGVHHGSAGPIYHTSDELAKFVDAWNGIPVTIQHPQIDGGFVSANIPEVIETQSVGQIFNTSYKDGKLKAEAWIDESKAEAEFPEILEYIRNNRPLDVSVGVFTEDDYTSGDWNGERYTGIARNYRPDHLALLPGAQGACAWSDGCGVRANSEGGGMLVKTYALQYTGNESTPWEAPNLEDFNVDGRWQDLSASDKAKVASHYLIGSSNAERFSDLVFPVVNPGTGKLNENALRAVIGGRGAQVTRVSATERDRARRRAYRLLNDEFDAELDVPETLEAVKSRGKDGYIIQVIGHSEIAGRIQSKLDRMDDDMKIHFLEEVFDGYFVYCVKSRNSDESELLKRRYEVTTEDTVEFTGEAVPVRKQVDYIVMESNEMEDKPCAKKVAALIANELTKFSADDKEWLETLSDEQLDKLEPEKVEAPQVNVEDAVQVLKSELSDPDKFMGFLPDETREQLKHGLRLHKEKREELIKHITENTEVYKAEDLEGRDVEELEKLASVVKPKADYSINASGGRAKTSVTPLMPCGVGKEDK